MKRIISCLLAVLLLVSIVYPTSVIAAESDEPTFTVSSERAFPGQNVSVTIRMDHNPGIASIKLKAQFDNDALILNSITYNDSELGGQSQQPETFTSPVTLNWFNGAENTTGDMVYAVLDFTVAQNASFGKHEIIVTYNPDDVYRFAEDDDELDNVEFKIINGGVTVAYMIGDVDYNGRVESIDATWIQRSVSGKDIPFILSAAPADIDGDEKITTMDASLIQWRLAHKEKPKKYIERIGTTIG